MNVFQKLDQMGNRFGAAVCRMDAKAGVSPEYNLAMAAKFEALAARYGEQQALAMVASGASVPGGGNESTSIERRTVGDWKQITEHVTSEYHEYRDKVTIINGVPTYESVTMTRRTG